jgi:hypothetical protein
MLQGRVGVELGPVLTWRWFLRHQRAVPCRRRAGCEPVPGRDASENGQIVRLCDAPRGFPYPSFPLPPYPINRVPKSPQVPRKRGEQWWWWLIVINDVVCTDECPGNFQNGF